MAISTSQANSETSAVSQTQPSSGPTPEQIHAVLAQAGGNKPAWLQAITTQTQSKIANDAIEAAKVKLYQEVCEYESVMVGSAETVQRVVHQDKKQRPAELEKNYRENLHKITTANKQKAKQSASSDTQQKVDQNVQIAKLSRATGQLENELHALQLRVKKNVQHKADKGKDSVPLDPVPSTSSQPPTPSTSHVEVPVPKVEATKPEPLPTDPATDEIAHHFAAVTEKITADTARLQTAILKLVKQKDGLIMQLSNFAETEKLSATFQAEAQQKITTLRSQIEELTTKNSSLQTQIEQLEKSKKELQDNINTILTQKSSIEEQNVKLSESLSAEKNHPSRDKLRLTITEVSTLEHDLTEMRKKVEDANVRLQEAQQAKQVAEEALKKKIEEQAEQERRLALEKQLAEQAEAEKRKAEEETRKTEEEKRKVEETRRAEEERIKAEEEIRKLEEAKAAEATTKVAQDTAQVAPAESNQLQQEQVSVPTSQSSDLDKKPE